MLVVSTACRTTVEPAKPWVSGGDTAVTLGQPFGVMTSWKGECEPGALDMLGAIGEVKGTIPCNYVDYDVSVECDAGCTSSVDESMKTILVTPAKLGVLNVKVTLNPKSGILKKKKTLALKPVFVVHPTKAAVVCELGGDGKAQVDVTLVGDNKELVHRSDIKVAGGEVCRQNTGVVPHGVHKREFTCAIDALNATIEVSSPTYKLEAVASCALIYPAPHTARRQPEGHAFKLYDTYNNLCQHLVDETKKSFTEWGWKVGAIDDTQVGKTADGLPTGKARLSAERLGTTVNVNVEFNMNDTSNERGCTWTLDGGGTSLRGNDQLGRQYF